MPIAGVGRRAMPPSRTTLERDRARAAAVVRARFGAAPDVGDHPRHGTRRARRARSTSRRSIDYADIPGFPLSTVESHAGRLLCGTLGGKTVVAMQGRFHRYEGYSLQQVTFPVRVLRALGAKTLVVSNACGGMNPTGRPGDLMLIADHINLLGDNPLIGPNDDRLGPRFPDMSAPYDARLARARARGRARSRASRCAKACTSRSPGRTSRRAPSIACCARIGADVVGMSTVPEVIVAVHAGMRVLGLSIITDMCLPDALEPASRRADHRGREPRRAESHRARARRAGAAVTRAERDAAIELLPAGSRRPTTLERELLARWDEEDLFAAHARRARGRADVRVLRGPADGERPAGHPPRLRAHDQGSLLPPSRDEGLSRDAQGGLGHARPAGGDRGREAARHQRQAADRGARRGRVQPAVPRERVHVSRATGRS